MPLSSGCMAVQHIWKYYLQLVLKHPKIKMLSSLSIWYVSCHNLHVAHELSCSKLSKFKQTLHFIQKIFSMHLEVGKIKHIAKDSPARYWMGKQVSLVCSTKTQHEYHQDGNKKWQVCQLQRKKKKKKNMSLIHNIIIFYTSLLKIKVFNTIRKLIPSKCFKDKYGQPLVIKVERQLKAAYHSLSYILPSCFFFKYLRVLCHFKYTP